MKTYKNLTLTVNKKKQEGDNLPNYNLSTKDGENFINIGGAWKKQDKNNQTYISIGLANAFDKDNQPLTYKNQAGEVKQRDGYVLVHERDLRELMKKVTLATGEAHNENIPF